MLSSWSNGPRAAAAVFGAAIVTFPSSSITTFAASSPSSPVLSESFGGGIISGGSNIWPADRAVNAVRWKTT